VIERLSKSIVIATGAYFALQIGIFLAFALPVGFFSRYALLFFSVSSALHALLSFILLWMRQDFVKEPSGERLEEVNLANRITLFRVSTLPTLLVLVLAAKEYRIRFPLLALVVLVFISDFADGYVSRKAGETTRIGRMLDSASDYSLLIVLTIVFQYFDLIPRWLFALVMARLGIQALFMCILIVVQRRLDPKTTIMGKVAIASIMVLYSIEILCLIVGAKDPPVVLALEYAAGAIAAAGIADKAVAFVRSLRGSAGGA